MRPSGGWITPVDQAILAWYGETEIIAPPKVVWINTKETAGYSYDQIKRRMRTLEDAEFLVKYPDEYGYYELGDLGRRWLDGDISPGEMRDLDPR